jgi:hypothetical protein
MSFSKTMKLDDATGRFIALTFSEASEIIKDRMQNLLTIMEHLDPTWFKPSTSNKRGFDFDSIHFDTYNRYAEKAGCF